MQMLTLHLMSLLISFAIVLPLDDDHIALHQADIDALESHAAHVSIEPREPSPFDQQQAPQHRIAKIFIPESWHGGDEALTHIERIFLDAPDPKPVVYILGTPQISADGLKKLELTLPKGSLTRRSPVSLGISHNPQLNEVGVRVSQVQRESSAALAGIVPDDLITMIDETEIIDFDTLIESLAHRKPGQSVTVNVVRNGENRQIVVKLKGWYVEKDENQRTKR